MPASSSLKAKSAAGAAIGCGVVGLMSSVPSEQDQAFVSTRVGASSPAAAPVASNLAQAAHTSKVEPSSFVPQGTLGAVTATATLAAAARLGRKRAKGRVARKADEKPMMYDLEVAKDKTADDNLAKWMELIAPGKAGEPIGLGDQLNLFKQNMEQLAGGKESTDGVPLAQGDLASLAPGLTDDTLYLGLQKFQEKYGDIFKLCYGPKSFMVASDPAIFKHLLAKNTFNYNKGMLEEIMQDVWGNGIITADFPIWKERRKAIVPGFSKGWLKFQVGEFGKSTERFLDQMRAKVGEAVDVEAAMGDVALDVIAKACFNFHYDKEGSQVVQSSIKAFKEVENRAKAPFPYWELPFADALVPELVERQKDLDEQMKLLNAELDKCIAEALNNRKETDVADMEKLDYSKVANPSLLRILVDMKGAETTGKQIRDDCITLLVAGHQTTQSVLTWAIFELAQQPDLIKRLQDEVDSVLGDRTEPTYEDVEKMELLRYTVAETLRMYPVPAIMIRRALADDTLPAGGTGVDAKVLRGQDFFLSTYNMQRNSKYWPNPDKFDPDRFKTAYKNPDVPEWAGYDPAKIKGSLYPNEIATDYAFVPFGGGARKCPGDIFSMLEASVILSLVVREFNFEFTGPTASPADVGTSSAATINTKNGLWMKLSSRK